MEEAGTVWRSLGHFFYVVDNEPATCEENGDEMEECKRCYRLRKGKVSFAVFGKYRKRYQY